MLIKMIRKSRARHNASLSGSVSSDIAIIGGRGYHSRYGGVENAIREISNHLTAATPLNITVYGTNAREGQGTATTQRGLVCHYAPQVSYRYFGQHGAIFACVLHCLMVARPSTVLIFASGPCVFVPLFRLFGTPVITSLRAIDSARDKWGVVSRTILRLGEYFAWRYATVFTANSKEMIRAFKNRRPDGVFIPNGSRAAHNGNSGILNELALNKGGYFLFAARLDPVKRLHLLLNAHAQLAPQDRLPLIVAGGHSKSEKYQNTLHRLAAANVEFLGHVPACTLDPLMRHCRAFILPSVLEGMSNSLLSAMATGCAVLASDISPNTDVLKNTDAVFKTDDLTELKRGLETLSRDRDFAARLGGALKQHAGEHYSWQRTADLFYQQIKPCLERVNANV